MKTLYELFRFLVHFTFPPFYRQFSILRRASLQLPKGGIVATNHPSTLMDPLNGVAWFPFQVKFLANWGLFASPVSGWFFRTLYCIPIQRREDMGEGKSLNNKASFGASTQHLQRGGHLFMAPEGTCPTFRHILPLKSGVARIALAAEAANDFKLGTAIFPMGLCYWNPYDYRSRLLINPGSAIPLAQFEDLYRDSPALAQKALLAQLKTSFEALTLHSETEAEDNRLVVLEEFALLPLHWSVVSLEIQWESAKKLQTELLSLKNATPPAYEKLVQFLDDWQITGWANGFSANTILNSRQKNSRILLLGVLMAPLYGWVMLLTLFPQGLADKLPIWTQTHLSYYPTYRYVAKLFLLPVCFISLLALSWGQGWTITICVLSLFVGANICRKPLYAFWHDHFLPAWRWNNLKRTFPAKATEIEQKVQQLQQSVKVLLGN